MYIVYWYRTDTHTYHHAYQLNVLQGSIIYNYLSINHVLRQPSSALCVYGIYYMRWFNTSLERTPAKDIGRELGTKVYAKSVASGVDASHHMHCVLKNATHIKSVAWYALRASTNRALTHAYLHAERGTGR